MEILGFIVIIHWKCTEYESIHVLIKDSSLKEAWFRPTSPPLHSRFSFSLTLKDSTAFEEGLIIAPLSMFNWRKIFTLIFIRRRKVKVHFLKKINVAHVNMFLECDLVLPIKLYNVSPRCSVLASLFSVACMVSFCSCDFVLLNAHVT